jgi:hypothetical protein
MKSTGPTDLSLALHALVSPCTLAFRPTGLS